MRAELAAIDDPSVRRQFARSAARAAFATGPGIHVGLMLGSELIVATIAVTVPRTQPPRGDARVPAMSAFLGIGNRRRAW